MNIENFKNAIGGGVRPALFRVGGRIGASGIDEDTSFLVTAAQLPESTLGSTEAPYRGRTIKLPTSRTFADWQISILSDEAMALRNKFESWIEDLNGSEDNIAERNISLVNTTDFPDWSVDQLDRNGDAIKSYTMKYCYPTSVGAVSLAAGEEGLLSFDVTLAYSYFITSDVNVGYGVPGNRTPAN